MGAKILSDIKTRASQQPKVIIRRSGEALASQASPATRVASFMPEIDDPFAEEIMERPLTLSERRRADAREAQEAKQLLGNECQNPLANGTRLWKAPSQAEANPTTPAQYVPPQKPKRKPTAIKQRIFMDLDELFASPGPRPLESFLKPPAKPSIATAAPVEARKLWPPAPPISEPSQPPMEPGIEVPLPPIQQAAPPNKEPTRPMAPPNPVPAPPDPEPEPSEPPVVPAAAIAEPKAAKGSPVVQKPALAAQKKAKPKYLGQMQRIMRAYETPVAAASVDREIRGVRQRLDSILQPGATAMLILRMQRKGKLHNDAQALKWLRDIIFAENVWQSSNLAAQPANRK